MKQSCRPGFSFALCAVLAAVASASTNEEDLETATLLASTCDFNTYMCCWTDNDGPTGMISNADVCRIADYPEEGVDTEMRGDDGPVYCHGFAWADDADPLTHIFPLYQYVTNYERTEEGGFYGNVLGSPECGCIEEMPVVSNAECSRFSTDGIGPCGSNLLDRHYSGYLSEPRGEIVNNLVGKCDNEEVPDYDFRSCDYNAFMCCWTENDRRVEDNTDVCRWGSKEWPGDNEGDVHCHGFVWPEDASDRYIDLLAQRVYTSETESGYHGRIRDAPTCGCVEDMPEVSKADCTMYQDDEYGNSRINNSAERFKNCEKNDLRVGWEQRYSGSLPNPVGECDNA